MGRGGCVCLTREARRPAGSRESGTGPAGGFPRARGEAVPATRDNDPSGLKIRPLTNTFAIIVILTGSALGVARQPGHSETR